MGRQQYKHKNIKTLRQRGETEIHTHTCAEEIETYKSKERYRDGERHRGTKTRKERTEKRDRQR